MVTKDQAAATAGATHTHTHTRNTIIIHKKPGPVSINHPLGLLL